MNTLVTIITPTTGKKTLFRLIDSIEKQNISYVHILLWDDKREDSFLFPGPDMKTQQPEDLNMSSQLGYRYSIVIPGNMVLGSAAGSSLRAIAMMAANTIYVTFADDDVWWEDGHLKSLFSAMNGKSWAYCKRRIWTDENECLGIDNFESVGDNPDRKVAYEMVDNNTLMFSRRLGTSAAVLYRETNQYNDDRLFYAFLKQYGGNPGKTEKATINQICPKRLELMFRQLCTKE